MKHLVLIAALAAFTVAPAAAQSPPMPTHAQMQQMAQMHRQVRAQILGALTPAHKALLAQIAGELATSVDPNYDAAAARLDAALTSAEKQRIGAAAESMHAKMRSMMHGNMMSMPPGAARMMNGKMPTAGGLLLMLTAGHGPEMMMHP